MILLEILIGLTITTLLLTFLFSFFVQTAKIEKKLETARMAILSRSHFQTRLQSVLSSLDRGANMEAPLYTKYFEKEKQPSLIALFDNGIDPDPQFSGTIMARLFIDEENRLVLATWPLNTKSERIPHHWRKEILLPRVESVEFEFLTAQSGLEHGKKEKLRSINANCGWRALFPKQSLPTPSLIRLMIQEERREPPLRFAFILPYPEPSVLYRGKKV